MDGYTFRQYDSRWGGKNYNGSSTMAAAGCGPTSCACLIYTINPKINPWQTATYMKKHGYAIRNAGTAWAGIPACLKAFGMKDVHETKNMSETFAAMKKGYLAVFLFHAGTRGGVKWTGGGHYLAVCGYKEKNGKHYFYMRDPGQRKNDGWFCYEDTMRGLIPCIWVCTYDKSQKKEIKPTTTKSTKTTYKKSYPTATVSTKKGTAANIKRWQTFLCWWGTDVKIDGKFGPDTKKKTMAFQKKYGLVQDGSAGPKTIAKAKQVGKKEKH